MCWTHAFVTDVDRMAVFEEKPQHKLCKLYVSMNINLFILNIKCVAKTGKGYVKKIAHFEANVKMKRSLLKLCVLLSTF